LRENILRFWLMLFIMMTLFSGCGESEIMVVKEPTDTTKLIRAAADDETDWTWFVGTDASFVKVDSKDTLTIESRFYEGIPKEVEHFQYFIDSDNNADTGFSYGRDSWRISGADFLVEDGDLYKSDSRQKWQWHYVGKFSRYEKRKLKDGVVKITFSSNNSKVIGMLNKSKMPTHLNITIEPFDKNWGSTYSTISTDHVKLKVDSKSPLKDTMVLDPKREDATIDIHDNSPAGAYITYEEDAFVKEGEKVVELHGAGMQNSFHFIGYETEIKYNWWSLPSHQNRLNISWDGKFDDDFIVFIVLKFKTAEGKILRNDLVYGPSEHGYVGYTDSFLYIPLGKSAEDGKWHHFERNVLDDLHRFYPEATIDYDDNYSGLVNGFAIRGAGRVTNIKLSAN
jgi:hypothetical protein